MDKDKNIALNTINEAICYLTQQREQLLATMPLVDKVNKEDWIIEKSTNTYYQFVQSNITTVYIERNNTNRAVETRLFNLNFRLAEKWEVEQHLDFLQIKALAKANLFNKLQKGNWIIQNSSDTFYQVGEIDVTDNSVILHRPDGKITATAYNININFRLANQQEIESQVQSLYSEFQEKEKKQLLPEFYMITVKGENGTKVRHESFEVAVKEATRLATVTQSRAHIMSVKAIVEPTIVQEPKIEYKLISS